MLALSGAMEQAMTVFLPHKVSGFRAIAEYGRVLATFAWHVLLSNTHLPATRICGQREKICGKHPLLVNNMLIDRMCLLQEFKHLKPVVCLLYNGKNHYDCLV